jgi:hypothetical protein
VQIDIGKQKVVWILKHKEHDRVAAGNALRKKDKLKFRKMVYDFKQLTVNTFGI